MNKENEQDEWSQIFGDELPERESMAENLEDRVYRALAVSVARVFRRQFFGKNANMNDWADSFAARRIISAILSHPERVLTGQLLQASKAFSISEEDLVEKKNIYRFLGDITQILISGKDTIRPVKPAHRFPLKSVFMASIIGTYKVRMSAFTVSKWYDNLPVFEKAAESLAQMFVTLSSRFAKDVNEVKEMIISKSMTTKMASLMAKLMKKDVIRFLQEIFGKELN